MDNSNGYR